MRTGAMRIGAIVQARMTSQRLPGKSLRPLCGKALLQYVLERLAQLESVETVVATSTDSSDNPIADFCTGFGALCFRGSLEDVAGRFLQTARAHNFAAFARISGDSPLLDQRLVARAIDVFTGSNADLATNVFPRTYPAGMSVEIVRTATFERLVPELTEPSDREHVTAYFYTHTDRFRIANFTRDIPRRDVHLAVDTEEHFQCVARIIGSMTRPHWEYSLEDVLRLHEAQGTNDATPPTQVSPSQVSP
jgi:spore coat polysaccharide biosynthesis protein SpsF